MNILIVGSGGREHALVWKLSQSKLTDKIFCAPGNAGISKQAECVSIDANDIAGLVNFVQKEKIDFTVVGPEAPLVSGIVDEFIKNNLKVFGPNKKAAQLEASKVFSKQFMARNKIPTAAFQVFDNPDQARKYIEKIHGKCVIKADGLAQGKGVVVANTKDEALLAIDLMMKRRIFGNAADRVIVEECLEGEEASILFITDSKVVLPLASSQDHKRIFDNDLGPNTGGMGAYSPAPSVTKELFAEIQKKVINRTIEGMSGEGIDYRGLLYAGIMITKTGPKVLEFNVRFGDPETQAILPRLKSDLLEVMLKASDANLGDITKKGGLSWDERSCVCVVCASGGYPEDYKKNMVITGLDEAEKLKDVVVFHAGTKEQAAEGISKIVNSGGRVLGVTGLGSTIEEAIGVTYNAVSKISFEGMHYRRDIAKRALKRG